MRWRVGLLFCCFETMHFMSGCKQLKPKRKGAFQCLFGARSIYKIYNVGVERKLAPCMHVHCQCHAQVPTASTKWWWTTCLHKMCMWDLQLAGSATAFNRSRYARSSVHVTCMTAYIYCIHILSIGKLMFSAVSLDLCLSSFPDSHYWYSPIPVMPMHVCVLRFAPNQ